VRCVVLVYLAPYRSWGRVARCCGCVCVCLLSAACIHIYSLLTIHLTTPRQSQTSRLRFTHLHHFQPSPLLINLPSINTPSNNLPSQPALSDKQIELLSLTHPDVLQGNGQHGIHRRNLRSLEASRGANGREGDGNRNERFRFRGRCW